MIEALASLQSLVNGAMLAGGLVFLRVAAAMAVLPAFGEQMIPARVRLALAFAFTAVIAPAVAPTTPPTTGALLALAGGEVAIGLLLGIALRLFAMALQIAGSMAAQATSLSQLFGAAGIDPQPAIAHLLMLAGLTLAVVLGLHVKIAAFFVQSYGLFPPGGGLAAGDVAAWGTAHVAGVFSLAFTLAMPFAIGALLYNLTLGIINRAMPQLMVALVGAPAITGLSLVLLFLAAPTLLSVWSDALDDFLVDPLGGG